MRLPSVIAGGNGGKPGTTQSLEQGAIEMAVVAVVNTLDGKIRLTYGEPTEENIARANEHSEGGRVVILSDEEYQNHA